MKIIEKLPFLLKIRHFEQIELLSKNFSPRTSIAYDITFITKHGIAYNNSTRPQNNIINMGEQFPKRFNSLAIKKKMLTAFFIYYQGGYFVFLIIIFRQCISVDVGEWSFSQFIFLLPWVLSSSDHVQKQSNNAVSKMTILFLRTYVGHIFSLPITAVLWVVKRSSHTF